MAGEPVGGEGVTLRITGTAASVATKLNAGGVGDTVAGSEAATGVEWLLLTELPALCRLAAAVASADGAVPIVSGLIGCGVRGVFEARYCCCWRRCVG